MTLVRHAGRALLFAGTLVLLPLVLFAYAVRARDYPRALLEPRNAASLTILDAGGAVLRQMATGSGGRQSFLALEQNLPHLVHATIASEDRRFYEHGGVDPVGAARAAFLDLKARRAAYGGSTLTMQLARMIEPLPRGRRKSFGDKLREALQAARLERIADKTEILEQYLNRVYYGNGAWGAEAAAQMYFGKPARELSLGEAALLAVLPRAPRAYDPYRHLGVAVARRSRVLALMERAGYIGAGDRELAERTPLALRRDHPDFRAPHFVDAVLARLPEAEREGATVRTTLDATLQREIEVSLRAHLDAIGRGVGQAGVVVLRNDDGAVLAWVGSRDYFDAERAGANSAITAKRRPGSTLKPFVYGIALERGDTPSSVAYDVVLADETHETYTTDVKQHGFARYREALAGSYNLAAVHTLRKVGPASLVERLRTAGVKTLDRDATRYGPSLAIGEAETRLIELTAAYAAFGTGGTTIVPRLIDRIELPGRRPRVVPVRPGATIFSRAVSFIIFDILSDPDARRPMFGDLSPVLPFAVALKTGTTRGYTDNLAFGVTRDYTVGAWAGNFDGKPTEGVMAMQGAAPLVRAAFVAIGNRFGEPAAPPRPDGIVEADVCAVSGMKPSSYCHAIKHERFIAGTVPAEPCTWHQPGCDEYPREVRSWARAQGMLSSPQCDVATDALRILFPAPDSHFLIDPGRPLSHQVPPLRASPAEKQGEIRWTIDGRPAQDFRPTVGEHRVRAEHGGVKDEVRIYFD